MLVRTLIAMPKRDKLVSLNKLVVRSSPGLGLCSLVGGSATLLQSVESAIFGRAWIETLVLAILVGTAIRTVWTPGALWRPGIDLSAKLLLEVAVVFLGASISASTILSVGPALLFSILAIVPVAILLSVGIGRTLGLSKRLAVLVACGNSICGNSAIAAVAPIVRARADEVAASIAFTAVLGVIVVLALPPIGAIFRMTQLGYGTLTGLTVYAVPQVLAASAPVGKTAVQIGMVVKLVRVLTLGPVCLSLSLISPRFSDGEKGNATQRNPNCRRLSGRPHLHELVPWFVIGFVVMLMLRSANAIPQGMVPAIGGTASVLTVVSMAALGLGVDVRTVSKAGISVTATVIISLLILGSASFLLVTLLRL